MRYDLHIHSRYSPDSMLEIREIVKVAVRKGLQGIAITDHNTIKGGLAAKKLNVPDLEIICGCEFKTECGEVIGLFLTEELGRSGRGVEEIIDEIRDQGGIVVVPHPFDRLRSSIDPLRYRERIDAIEAMNARSLLDRYNEKAAAFGSTWGVALVGGSDAHTRSEIGRAWTYFEGDDLRDAIVRGETMAGGKRSCVLNRAISFSVKLLKKIGY
ncbi:MAG TPA: PHP domain-containing protein [Candidatus Syntrophoarchaeum butanivorans]|uniref:Histidinol phosphatase n=1 Tax=Candidatus Syntropharchaeum butanivorans TaxID=1839936 RepID=A0A1F2P4H1_9EURY|nr:MAG: histidinol phosphatase [Candidatus Syntrophoarchaeum butanivorans]RJS70628.1 MAG: PHP domain-containing protein [Candidatus Syntrophoarchaeum sp. WYZ-LMO15]HDM36439.1 PHP domain-containing protein [Candidatus Syntrophoarchaeum butanivorans]HEC57311.1 PHP domain-containing protein [Candidatus Syntrophoarchaeum butanivorans]